MKPAARIADPALLAAARCRRLGLAVVCCSLVLFGGCRSTGYLTPLHAPRNPLAESLRLTSWKGPQASARTSQMLRQMDLAELHEEYSPKVLTRLQNEVHRSPTAETFYALAEVSYLYGVRAQQVGDGQQALDLYGVCVTNAYEYLFDPRFDRLHNVYDPNFRGACDLYNAALEGMLRIVNQQQALRAGTTINLKLANQYYNIAISLRGDWHPDEFEKIEFVSDYAIEGLNNHHRSYGLGVPLIAVRKRTSDPRGVQRFYPPGMSYPITAFLRVVHHADGQHIHAAETQECFIELYDSLIDSEVHLASRSIPLETDLTVPLGYTLDNPEFRESKNIATLGLLNPGGTQQLSGLFMLEPYDASKIPVLMVHGLWSSPLTWMEMFNDLRSYPEIRDRYQFWFYLYPTGQPFWVSATGLRDDLARLRQTIDPDRRNLALEHMVLVGHSMGGLVSKMQVIDSGDRFWRIVSDKPFDQLRTDRKSRDELAKMLFFQPNPSIKRVVTIGTPHRGSNFANGYTRWLGRKFIRLPHMMQMVGNKLLRENPGFFRDTQLLTTTTSLDSLSPESPILPALISARRAPWVRHHNVVGLLPQDRIVTKISGEGDGIVPFESAHLEDSDTELVVPADHVKVHQHPRSILAVRGVLLDHLQDYAWATQSATHAIPAVHTAAPFPKTADSHPHALAP